jgi:hypothetical protein
MEQHQNTHTHTHMVQHSFCKQSEKYVRNMTRLETIKHLLYLLICAVLTGKPAQTNINSYRMSVNQWLGRYVGH